MIRKVGEAPEKTRCKWISDQNLNFIWQSNPAWDVYKDDDKVWKLLDYMRELSEEIGKTIK